MPVLRLNLIGPPRLLVDGTEVTIKPRTVFELLAVILISCEGGVSRTDVVERLWGHLDAEGRRQQLRIALSKLRKEIELHSLEELFELSTEQLRFRGELEVDIWMFNPERADLEEVRSLLQPITDGWNPDRWVVQSDAFGEQIAKCLARTVKQATEKADVYLLLSRAISLYPTSVQLHLTFIQFLRWEKREAEIVELIIGLEVAWLDRFGTNDFPNLHPAEPARNETEQSGPRPHTPATTESKGRWLTAVPLFAVAAGVAFFSLVAIGKTNNNRPKPKTQLHIEQNVTTTVAGNRYRQILFTVQGASPGLIPVELKNLSDQTALLTAHNGNETEQFRVSRSGDIDSEAPNSALLDDLGGCRITRPKAEHVFNYVCDTKVQTIEGTLEYPRPIFRARLDDGSILFDRYCLHVYYDHHHPFLWKDGHETRVDSPRKDARIVYLTYRVADRLFGRYTLGSQEQWHYHTFYFDLKKKQSVPMNTHQVVRVLTDGNLITAPEKTYVVEGDTRTDYDGRLLIQSPEGKILRTITGPVSYPNLRPFGNIFNVYNQPIGPWQKTGWCDLNGHEIQPFPLMPKRATREAFSFLGHSMLVGYFDEKATVSKYLLITQLDDNPNEQRVDTEASQIAGN